MRRDLLDPPADLVRLTTVLSEHKGLEPILDREKPSVAVWTVEEDGELYPWLLVSILERTCVVQHLRRRYDRVLRGHQHAWVQPAAIADWRKPEAEGHRGQNRRTWLAEQSERGRQNSLARRRAEARYL